MPYLVYDDLAPRGAGPRVPLTAWGTGAVTRAWERHARNRAYLEFMARRGTRAERAMAEAELVIAGRKLLFWERHPAYNPRAAERVLANLNRQWEITPCAN